MFYRFFISLILISSGLILPAFAEGVTLYSKDELHFELKDDAEFVFDKNMQPFDGAVMLVDDNGDEVSYVYKQGQKDGVAVSHYANGQVKLETTYAGGVKNGEEIAFSQDGLPQYKKTYQNGQLGGEYILFYDDGKPKQKSQYFGGKLNGETIYFDRQGNVERIENYKDDLKNGVERIVKDNILVAENVYENGKLHGVCKRFNEKYLTDEINYADNQKEGKHVHYEADGSRSEVMYKQDKRNGFGIRYYPNHKMAERISYVNDAQNGWVEKWNQDGIRLSAENYKDDRLDGIGRYFDEHGYLQSVKYYIKGAETAAVIIDDDKDLGNIYDAYLNGVMNKYSAQKNMWYKILWLGLNTEKGDILHELAAQMNMYGEKIADSNAYKRASAQAYEQDNRLFYFGLSPLGYAVNIAAPVSILHQLAVTPEQASEQNARGTTVLQEAVRLNSPETVEFLLKKGADITAVDGRNILFDAVVENAPLKTAEALHQAGVDVNIADNMGQTALQLAIKKHNVDYVRFLLKNGADVKLKTSSGESVLNYALHYQAPDEIVRLLVAAGVDVNMPNTNGDLPIIAVIRSANTDILEKLLVAGADINKIGDKGHSALSFVLKENVEPQIVDLVLSQPQDLEHNVAHFHKMLWQVLAEQNRLKYLDAVLAQTNMTKPDINDVVPQNYLLKQKDNPELIDIALKHIATVSDDLMWLAVQNADAISVEKLLKKGGKAELKDSEGISLLATAVKNNDVKTAEVLLAYGADANAKINGDSLLMMLTHEQAKMTDLLLQNGADLNYKNSTGQTVLMRAVRQLNTVLSAAALAQKIDVNARDDDGNTVVHYLAKAVQNYENMPTDKLKELMIKTAKMLIDAGADINEPDANGATILILLAQQKLPLSADLIAALEANGADATAKDQYGHTAQYYLAQ